MDSRRIVTFITELTLDHTPAAVIDTARYAILDTFGVGLAGSLLPASEAVYRFVSHFPMAPMNASVWGRVSRTSCLWAALANGWSSACLDADDGHRQAMGHPGGVVVPAAAALAESVDATGQQFIEAVIVGYEIALRVGIFLNRDPNKIYFGSGTWAGIGAAAACAKLMQLNPVQILSTLSLAEVNTPLALIMNWIHTRQIPDVKEGMGWGALTGVGSALLAKQGVNGSFSLTAQPDGQMITHDLGHEFETSKIYFKQHSSCRWTHAAIDSTLQLVKRHQINPKQIKKVIVATHRKATHLDNALPSRAEEAQYSIPYTVAAAILHGCVGLPQMVPEAISDPRTVMLAQKIEVRYDEECERRFPEAALARLTIETIDGKTLTAEPSTATKGDYQDPFTGIELEHKFRSYAGAAISADQVDAILEAIKKIEVVENVKALTRRLCTMRGRPHESISDPG